MEPDEAVETGKCQIIAHLEGFLKQLLREEGRVEGKGREKIDKSVLERLEYCYLSKRTKENEAFSIIKILIIEIWGLQVILL